MRQNISKSHCGWAGGKENAPREGILGLAWPGDSERPLGNIRAQRGNVERTMRVQLEKGLP